MQETSKTVHKVVDYEIPGGGDTEAFRGVICSLEGTLPIDQINMSVKIPLLGLYNRLLTIYYVLLCPVSYQ